MITTSKHMIGVAVATLLAACGMMQPDRERTASADSTKATPSASTSAPSSPTAPSSASSSSSSTDTSMTGSTPATGPSRTTATGREGTSSPSTPATVAGADMSGTAAKPGSGTPELQSSAAAAVALSEVKSPKTTLRGAKVVDAKGEAVGEVKSVRLGANGEVSAVNVAIGKRTVALKADTLTYVQADNTLLAKQTKEELTR